MVITWYDLLMLTTYQQQKISAYFKNQKEVVLVYLFGSRAKNQSNEKSDIDIAILFSDKSKNSFYLLGKYIEELSHLLNTKVDVASLNDSDVFFGYRVISEGKLLFERRPMVRFKLVISLIKRYFDLKPTYEVYNRELTQRARKGILGY